MWINGEDYLEDMNSGNDFWEVWQEQYEELCVLQSQITGLCHGALSDLVQVGLNRQIDRLFMLHGQLLEKYQQQPNPEQLPDSVI